MKTTWRNVALGVLLAAGGVGTGITVLSSSWKSPSSNSAFASMQDASMVSMQSDSHSCENCIGNDYSKCVLGICSGSNHGMGMISDSVSCDQCSNSDHSQCTTDRCTPGEAVMKMTDAPATSPETMSTVQMMDAKMSEAKMTPAMAPVMADKSMVPMMHSREKADQNGSMIYTKM